MQLVVSDSYHVRIMASRLFSRQSTRTTSLLSSYRRDIQRQTYSAVAMANDRHVPCASRLCHEGSTFGCTNHGGIRSPLFPNTCQRYLHGSLSKYCE